MEKQNWVQVVRSGRAQHTPSFATLQATLATQISRRQLGRLKEDAKDRPQLQLLNIYFISVTRTKFRSISALFMSGGDGD